ncbi:MAG: hypothetical protein WC247_08295 [Porticoccaceae bacterium]
MTSHNIIRLEHDAMNIPVAEGALFAEVRDDYIDHRRFTSAEFAHLEGERLWTSTWHWACREEEIPRVGDYLVYDIGDQPDPLGQGQGAGGRGRSGG